MTPEERFEAHEQWLLDHDRAIARHEQEMAQIRATLADLTEVTLRIARAVLDRQAGPESGR